MVLTKSLYCTIEHAFYKTTYLLPTTEHYVIFNNITEYSIFFLYVPTAFNDNIKNNIIEFNDFLSFIAVCSQDILWYVAVL